MWRPAIPDDEPAGGFFGILFHRKTRVVSVSPKPTDGEERGRRPAFAYISGSSSEGLRRVASRPHGTRCKDERCLYLVGSKTAARVTSAVYL